MGIIQYCKKILRCLKIENKLEALKPTNKEIDNLCQEIERQWNIHLMTRAVFHSHFGENNEYESPSFYKFNGFSFKVKLQEIKSERWLESSKGVGTWLNQNYVIRLYGILDSKSIRKILPKPEVIDLLEILRMNVGAHSTGNRVSKKSQLKKATQIINKLFDINTDIHKVEDYNLSIDTVLEPMKTKVIEYLESLKDN
jgi:hypothetical protein